MRKISIFLKIVQFALYYFGIIMFSYISLFLIVNFLDAKTLRQISVFFGGPTGRFFYIFALTYLFIGLYILFSIVAFLILNKFTKRYSYKWMLIISIIYIILVKILSEFGIFFDMEILDLVFLFIIMIFPIILLVKKRINQL